MKSRPLSYITASAMMCSVLAGLGGFANAQDSESQSSDTWIRSAESPAPNLEDVSPHSDLHSRSPRSAGGSTWAPGGIGATNNISVKGQGRHVDNIVVSYNQGGDLSNACVDTFEVAYNEGGVRKVETAGKNCALWRTTHEFEINRDLDADTTVCGRVQVGGSWGNYACIEIKE